MRVKGRPIMKNAALEKRGTWATVLGCAFAIAALVLFFIDSNVSSIALAFAVAAAIIAWYLIGLLDADQAIYKRQQEHLEEAQKQV